MSRTTASLVYYDSSIRELDSILRELNEDPSFSAWVVVDNGAAEDFERGRQIQELTRKYGGRYLASPNNVGFGAGHNAALKNLRDIPSDFHLMVNPDVIFGREVVPAIVDVMDKRKAVGLIMPRVVYPDGTTQHLCKLLPTPLDFAIRRFLPGPLHWLARNRMESYELRNMDLSQPAEVPFLSGCFMFTRRAVLESVGAFDERYFLYMEDVDLCRRLARVSQLVYWPSVSVAHRHERGSHKSLKLTLTHIWASVRYFNKWGWIFDRARKNTNLRVLAQIGGADSDK
jgi:GT2 family glycosyltransferase